MCPRLDRGATEKLRLPDGAASLRLHTACQAVPATCTTKRSRRSHRGWQPSARCSCPDTCEYRSERPARSEAASVERSAHHAWSQGTGVLHEGRHQSSERNVYRRGAHGRPGLWRSGQRQRLGNCARHGGCTRLQQPGRAARAVDQIHSLEQQGTRSQRQPRLRRPAAGAWSA